jgi:hypothetical protein
MRIISEIYKFSRHEVGFQENTQKWEINGGGNETDCPRISRVSVFC